MSATSSNPNSNLSDEEKEKLVQEDKDTVEVPVEEVKQEEKTEKVKIEDKEVIEPKDLLFIEDAPELAKPEPSGDAKLDLVQNMLHEKGIDHKAILKEINETKTLTEESITNLKSKLGEAGFDMLVAQVKEIGTAKLNSNNAKVTTLMNVVAKEAYGEDATVEQGTTLFKEMQPWLAENLKPEAKVEVNKALKEGGYIAEVMLERLVKEFKMSSLFKDTINTQEASSTGTPEYKGISIKNSLDLANQLKDAKIKGDTQQRQRIEEHFNKFRYTK